MALKTTKITNNKKTFKWVLNPTPKHPANPPKINPHNPHPKSFFLARCSKHQRRQVDTEPPVPNPNPNPKLLFLARCPKPQKRPP